MPNYHLASGDITHQLLDGEVVAIDFKSGHYYNLRGAAGAAFDALVQGVESERLPALFSAAPADAPAQLARLVASWVEVGLLAVTAQAAAPIPTPPAIPWGEPSFETYTDMQQLLLADPIHDVGDGAWPRQVETKP